MIFTLHRDTGTAIARPAMHRAMTQAGILTFPPSASANFWFTSIFWQILAVEGEGGNHWGSQVNKRCCLIRCCSCQRRCQQPGGFSHWSWVGSVPNVVYFITVITTLPNESSRNKFGNIFELTSWQTFRRVYPAVARDRRSSDAGTNCSSAETTFALFQTGRQCHFYKFSHGADIYGEGWPPQQTTFSKCVDWNQTDLFEANTVRIKIILLQRNYDSAGHCKYVFIQTQHVSSTQVSLWHMTYSQQVTTVPHNLHLACWFYISLCIHGLSSNSFRKNLKKTPLFFTRFSEFTHCEFPSKVAAWSAPFACCRSLHLFVLDFCGFDHLVISFVSNVGEGFPLLWC